MPILYVCTLWQAWRPLQNYSHSFVTRKWNINLVNFLWSEYGDPVKHIYFLCHLFHLVFKCSLFYSHYISCTLLIWMSVLLLLPHSLVLWWSANVCVCSMCVHVWGLTHICVYECCFQFCGPSQTIAWGFIF